MLRLAPPANRRPARPRLREVLLALTGSLALASCGDGTGPGGGSADVTFYAIRFAESDLGLWRYEGGSASKVSPDSLDALLATSSFAIAPDGRVAYVIDRPALLRVDIVEQAADGRRLRTIVAGPQPAGGGTRPRQLAYSADGSRLAWIWTRSDAESLYVADAGATVARSLAGRVRSIPAAPMRWSPQGDIVFGPPGTLAGVDPATGAVRPIATLAGLIHDYDLAADGRLVVSVRQTGEFVQRIFVQSSAGGPLTQIPGSAGKFSDEVRWAPDGRRIATIGPDTTFEDFGSAGMLPVEWPVLRVLSLDGAAVRQTGVQVASIHAWTSDGRVVLSGGPARLPMFVVDVYVVDPRGGARNLSETPLIDERLTAVVR